MDERFAKLDKYFEAGTPKKHQRSESTTNGSKGALNVKIATRMKSVNQNIEDPPKNICLNKRARTSMAEFQANGQINRPKNQSVAMAKGVNSVNNNGERSNQFEKNRRLDAVEEGWDKKIKRKRSIGTILSKPNDSDSGIMFKRSAQNRAINEQHGVQQHQRDNNHKPSFGQSQSQSQKPPKVPRTRSSSNLVSEDDRSPSNRSLKITVKLDKHQFRIKDSGGGERQTRGKMGTNTGPSVTLPKKNKSVVNEESVWKQGRTARGLMVKKCSIPPMGKELDILQKNVSKSGRRLKRLSEYKGLSNDAPLQNIPSPHSTGDSDHDKEELLSAAYHPSVPITSSSPSWKNLVPQFPPITFNENSLLSQQQQLCLDSLPYVKTKPHTPSQQPGSPFFKKHEMDYKSCPIYKRVLSAIILQEGDDIDGLVDWDHPRSFPISTSHRSNNNNNNNNKNNNFIDGGQSLGLTKKSQNHSTSYEEMCSESFFGSHEYDQMCVDDKLLLELQCIGICLDTLPGLEDNEDVYICNEVDSLTQQGSSKGSSRSGNPEVPKEIATCHKSDKNCFNEFPLNDILFPQVNTTTTRKRSNRTPTKPPKKTDLPPTPKGKSVNKPEPPRHVNETSKTVNNRRNITEGNDHFTPPLPVVDLELINEELGAGGDFDALLSFNEGEDDDVDYSVGLAVPDDDLMGLGF